MFEFHFSSLYQIWTEHFSLKSHDRPQVIDKQPLEIETEPDGMEQKQQLESTAAVRRIAENYWLERRYFG